VVRKQKRSGCESGLSSLSAGNDIRVKASFVRRVKALSIRRVKASSVRRVKVSSVRRVKVSSVSDISYRRGVSKKVSRLSQN